MAKPSVLTSVLRHFCVVSSMHILPNGYLGSVLQNSGITPAHSAIGCSPFEALYGYTPKSLRIAPADMCQVADVASWMVDKQLMISLLQQHLHRAQQRMKKQADKGRTDRSFQVGEMVFLKLQPYIQSSLDPHANQKLAYKFFDPFKVLSKVGPVAYKLDLPPTASIHPVFHVSQLKKMVSSTTQVAHSIPDLDNSLQFSEQILAKKLISKGVHPVHQVLIKWSGWPASLTTWKDLEALPQRFPTAPAWGQAGSLHGECYDCLHIHS